MVSIHVKRFFPAQRLNSCICLGAQTGGLGTDEGVLAIGFIPHRNEFRAQLGSQNASLQLCPPLMPKAVAHTKGKFTKR